MAQVSFNIVTWNGARYLPELFDSLKAQTQSGVIVRVIDNASDDETREVVQSRGDITMVRNAKNLGFAPAHNQGIRLAIDKWEGADLDQCFVIVANQDLVLTPTCIEELTKALEAHPEAGSAQGKILRAYVEHPEDEYLTQTICADRIDSTGLLPSRSHLFSDRGEGEMDTGQYDEAGEVFGPTGALAIYRASALLSVRFEDEFFDGDYFMYREDVDLAWRLRRAGWKSRYVPTAVAYHHRGLAAAERAGLRERIRNRRQKRPILAALSTRNQILMLLKELGVVEAVVFSPWVIWRLSLYLGYACLFEWHVLRVLFRSVRLLPRLWKKRRMIASQTTVSLSERLGWFFGRL